MSGDSSVAVGDVEFQTILDRMGDGFFAVDADWRITYANEAGRAVLREAMGGEIDAETVEGLQLWESVPGAVDTVFYDRYHEAMESQRPVEFEEYYEPLDAWFDVRAFPSESGLSVYLRDVTQQRELERQRRESLHVLQELYAVSSDQERSFEQKVEAMLQLGCEYLDVPNGFLTKIEAGTQHIEISVATHAGLQPGQTCPLDEAYCKRTIELDELLTVVDATAEGWAEDPAYERFELGTYIGGRVEVGGELYGTLCFADRATRCEPFSDTNRTFVELLTRWVSYELERQRAQRQLERERDRLDEFASVVSHDLRNPLNTAAGRLELLAEETDSEHVPPIDRSLQRMETLIEDLLVLAREGMRVDEMTTVDLAALAHEAWETTATTDATLVVDAEAFHLQADESRLRQLLENLFRNAVEHGGDGVTVRIEPTADGFVVADDGVGLQEPAEVFEAGYTTSDTGTGFGLSIVKEIASAHGWDVTAGNGESGGARFTFAGIDRVE